MKHSAYFRAFGLCFVLFAAVSTRLEAAHEVEADFRLQGTWPSFPQVMAEEETAAAGGPVFFRDQDQAVRGVLRLRNLDAEPLRLEEHRTKWTDFLYAELKKNGQRMDSGSYRILWGKPAASKDVRKLHPGETVELPFEIETAGAGDSKILPEGQYRIKIGLNTLEVSVLTPLRIETGFRNFRVKNIESREERFNYFEYLYQRAFEEKNEAQMRTLLEEMITREPADDLTLARLGDFYFFKGEYAQALPFFERLLKTLETGGRKRLLGWQSEYLSEEEILELARGKAEAARRLAV